MLDDLRQDWTTLGSTDPLWAVLTGPDKRSAGWDLEEFLATGRHEVAESLAALASAGATPRPGTALDFGAGVGRLSQALAEHFSSVVGVDISSSMIEHARRLDRSEGRCRWVHNVRDDLAFQPSGSVDLVYSSLVLQHVPRPLALGYLREFGRVLAPGGVAVVQVVSRPKRTLRGQVAHRAPTALVRWGQRRILGYPAPMLMTTLPPSTVRSVAAGAGLEVLTDVEVEHSPDWVCTRWFLRNA